MRHPDNSEQLELLVAAKPTSSPKSISTPRTEPVLLSTVEEDSYSTPENVRPSTHVIRLTTPIVDPLTLPSEGFSHASIMSRDTSVRVAGARPKPPKLHLPPRSQKTSLNSSHFGMDLTVQST